MKANIVREQSIGRKLARYWKFDFLWFFNLRGLEKDFGLAREKDREIDR